MGHLNSFLAQEGWVCTKIFQKFKWPGRGGGGGRDVEASI